MIRYVRPVSSRAARGLVKEIYGQIMGEFGTLGEPLTLHSPQPALLAGVWCSFRESLVAGLVPRALKEIAAVSISRLNQCPYCADAHSVMLRAAEGHEAASRIRNGSQAEISDQKQRAVAEWALATRAPGAKILSRPPFSTSEAPEFIGTAVWMHYINRMSKIFLGKTLIPLKSDLMGLRSLAERLGGWYFAGPVRRVRVSGTSLRLLPQKKLPADLSWASPSPAIAQAFAAFADAAETAGAEALVPEVRESVIETVSTWNGTDPPLELSWLEDRLARQNSTSRPPLRLALLAALAPDRIVEGIVQDFQARIPGDEKLLGAIAWSSFAAARRIGCWLDPVVSGQ